MLKYAIDKYQDFRTYIMDRIKLHWKNKPYKSWRIVGLLIIAGFLFMRFSVWSAVERSNTQTATDHFDTIAQNDVANLRSQFEIYSNTLYSGRALFLASDLVSRQDWTKFIDAQNIKQRYPGVNSVGYIRVIDRAQASSFTKELNTSRLSSDTTAFSIHPTTTNKQLAVITYNAPEDARQDVIGYDLFSSPVRTLALDAARDTGMPRATAPLTLASDKPDNNTSLLFVIPVYDSSSTLNTVAQRRAALKGYVVLTLRTGVLLDSVVSTGHKGFAVTVSTNGKVLYQAGPENTHGLHRTTDIDVAGQVWRLSFSAPKNFSLGNFGAFAPAIFFWTSIPLAIILFLVLYFATNLRILSQHHEQEHATSKNKHS